MTWSEDDSEHFIDRGAYYVPERELQIEIVGDLVAAVGVAAPRIVELCPGEGLMTRALLARFPGAQVLALDGSPKMLDSTRALAGEDAARLETQLFDLAAADWRALPFAPDAVVTSLAVHHLDGPGKQSLFRDLAKAMAPGGVFVLADLIAPTHAGGVAVAAKTWDLAVRERSIALDGNLAAFERFAADHWNLYSDPDPDPGDQPSSVLELLTWLEAAGFQGADIHWMKAGHVILSARSGE